MYKIQFYVLYFVFEILILNAFYTALMTERTCLDVGDAVKLPKDTIIGPQRYLITRHDDDDDDDTWLMRY